MGGGGGGGVFHLGGGYFYILGEPQVASVLMGEGVWAPHTIIHNHCCFIPFQISTHKWSFAYLKLLHIFAI